ncbi:LysR family transcriptional regulator [Mesorhizobium sp.]|uniref:LysR family transcriptional regulator n=1 Tax=Mesorhizobium sp. TaxID=1871066 RepID=UPI000FE442B8|nr:LysR family transcriptional regulator [Mesorhizobium sp.]RWH72884.1 MAG: LysR family transcriptional regulator [Mesorhizobium sp.]RWL34230.1 MAG: LysR family transcriptional regulator [Mesorhizobium sp.]RWL35646.1 MAG: LysR family transcriptional regulator [Mesorhizobium sp.]RWL41056.1 MAG: LysR family transcriptional regulator [Mesorhizobium sp.]RWL52178.1 MAG: LysR family transcriptional regulator [Mesorhizobium sp.]
MQRPTLSDIAAFCAVARNRSFRRAADELGVTPSTLSHTISALEKQLGLRLLHRTTRSVATTEAGQNLQQRMEALLSEFDIALNETRQFRDTVSGSIRISAASAAILPLFDHVLPELRNKHPEIQIEFVADGRLIDIIEEGFDAGIRFGEMVPKDMIGVAFGEPSRFVAIASPSYFAQHGVPLSPSDLFEHQCIRMRLTTGRILRWKFEKGKVTETFEPTDGITLSDVPLQLEAAAKGLGIAYVWENAARPHIDKGSVRIVLREWAPPTERLLFYFPANRRTPPALRAFVEILQESDKHPRRT